MAIPMQKLLCCTTLFWLTSLGIAPHGYCQSSTTPQAKISNLSSAVIDPAQLADLTSPTATAYFEGPLSSLSTLISQRRYTDALGKIEELHATPVNVLRRGVALERLALLEGLALQGLGRFHDAIAAFTQATRFRATSADAWFFKAINELADNQPEVALRSLHDASWFGRAILVNPSMIQLILADAYYRAGDHVRSATAYQSALSQDPTLNDARLGLARIALDNEDRGNAIRLAREARQNQPDSQTVRFVLAQALLLHSDAALQRDDLTEARDILGTLREVPTMERECTRMYIRSLIGLGDIEKASTELATARRKFATDQELSRLERQIALEREGAAPNQSPSVGNS